MKILAVDDKEDARYLLESLLTGHGHHVETAANGEEALERLREGSFDLIISDILMPRMDGFQLCREVRRDKELRGTWFVFYTATYTHEGDAKLAMQVGADDFITKPADPATFMERIEKVLQSPRRVHHPESETKETEVLHLYNQRLVAKLEKRTQDLEEELGHRMRVEEELRGYARRLEILRSIDIAILESQSPTVVAEIAIRGLQSMLSTSRASITSVDTDAGTATVLAVESAAMSPAMHPGDVFPLEALGDVASLSSGVPCRIPDVRAMSSSSLQQEHLLSAGILSYFVVPLRARERLIGTLNVGFDRPEAFSEEEITSAIELANQLAIALGQAQMRQELDRHASDLERSVKELEQANREIESSYERLARALSQTVEALATAAEVRDPYTAGHQRRVTELAMAIAERLGLSAFQLEGLRVAGLMHDIGKLAIPSELLSKPSRLSETEMGLIRTHSEAGRSILSGIHFPWPVTDIVLQHHERMDGTGYPQGLSGDAILMEARILAVADVVEAMASHRPYRPALGIDKALVEIRQYAGVRYDSDVVEACGDVLESGTFAFSENE